MKIQSKFGIPLLAVFTIAIMMGMPYAFAETTSVSIPQGTSVPGCEKTNECFIPHEVTIQSGDQITWSNNDSAAHTVTAGSAADGPSGVFDSSLFMAGTTFSFQFDNEGDFSYFFMVHPWMNGIIHVGTVSAEKPSSPTPEVTSAKPTMESRVAVTLDHKISGGKVTSMIADGNSNSVIIELDAIDGGEITVTLPREIIDATSGNGDDAFFVLVDNEESVFVSSKIDSFLY